MNKKFLSAILFGALMVTSTGTFVSCKDYDEDIDSINKELTDIKSQLAALQQKVDAGKWVTSVTSTANGVAITMSDGQTLNITNGKDGAQGEAGAAGKDGKDGSVVEVKDGVLCINGVATEIKVAKEAPAALPCVKVEDGKLMVLGADGKYAATGIEAGAVTAAKVNGLWTITVDGETITIPGSAAMSYIDVLNGGETMHAIYAINKKDVTYSPYNKTLEKGLYTTLDRDLQIVVNPQGTDASVYDFSLMNSANVDTELKFKEAVPFEGVLTRATSENAIWVLAHDFTRYEDINEARTKNYLLFKSNDGGSHALTLSATSGETTVKTPYNLGASLKKMGACSVDNSYLDALLNEVYTPAPYSWTEWSSNAAGIYDYWLTIDQTSQNVKNATLYGVEILDEGHSFRYTRETGVNNSVVLRYNYILMDGTIVEGSKAPKVTVWMVEEMASANAIVLERLETALDATLISDRSKGEADVFALTTEAYSLDALTDQMSELDKIAWNADTYYNYELIGGEGANNVDNMNWAAANLIKPVIDKTKNTITFQFMVSPTYGYNFLLDTAYEYTMIVKDADADNVIATIVLPFEFSQPTLDITRVNGEKAIWTTIEGIEVLKLYGDWVKGAVGVEDKMFAPLFEAFTTAYDFNNAKPKWSVFVPNAMYYVLSAPAAPMIMQKPYAIMGETLGDLEKSLAELTYSSIASEWDTWTSVKNIARDIMYPIHAEYNFYGVYPATEEQVTDFVIEFASLLGDAQKVETKEASYTSNNVTREVILTDENFNLVDALGNNFFLFDGVKADGNIEARTDMNLRQGFEEGTEGFATDWTLVSVTPTAYYYKNGVKTSLDVDVNKSGSAHIKENSNTKTRYWEAGDADANNVLVTMLPAMEAKKDAGYAALAGGVQIQLPTSVGTTEPVTIEFTLVDVFGVEKTLSVVVKASK